MKTKKLLTNSSFLNLYQIFKLKPTFLCASLLVCASSVNAATKYRVNELKVIKLTSTSILKDVVVKGTVKNDLGDALAGASVSVKGTNVRVATNNDGEFQITSPDGGTLVFTYMGYVSQEISVGNKSLINVTMLVDDKKYQMNEVVIVGYGTQKRSDITGSVTSVPKERLSQLPVTNVLHAMEGAVAGIRISQSSSVPGSSAGVQVRGVNSINAGTSPLTVIDGVPFSNLGGSMNDINPNDIESIEILKDASAVAVYGTRGSSGVILITTKRGKTGKPTIRYSTFAGPEYQNKTLTPLTPEQYVQQYTDFLAQKNQKPGAIPVPNAYEQENYTAGKTTNWLDEISQQGFIQDHNLSISGGGDKIKYFVSGAYQKQKGVLKGYQFGRASFRSNLDATITDWLTAGTSLFFADNNTDGGTVSYSSAMQMSPYGRLRDANGEYTIFPMLSETYTKNPLLGLNADVLNRQKNLNGIFYAEIKPKFIPGLKYRLNTNYAFLPSRAASYRGANTGDTDQGTAAISNTETNSWIVENILTYDKNWGKHHLDVTALYSGQEKKYFISSTTGKTFINDEVSYNNIGAAAVVTASSFYSREALVSQMARFNYSYDSKYLFTATARRDGYSAFGSATNKYGTFPSVALGWNISNENFLKDVKQIDNIKLRASYGTSGNQAVGVYQTISTQGVTKYIFNGITATGLVSSSLLTSGVLGNAELNWESTTGSNFAIDFSILNSRISGTVEAYFTKTKDVLLRRQLPTITGFGSIFDNLGSVKNRGVEFTLNTVNVKGKDFTWSSNINFSSNRNEIVSLYGDGKDDIGNKWFIGKPLYAVYDYQLDGVWQVGEDASQVDPGATPGSLKFVDVNGDKKITEADRVYQGSSLPKWTGGIMNNFKYKQFGLSVLIQTAQGAKINNPLLNLQNYGGRVSFPQEVGYWTAANMNNTQPSLTYTNPKQYAYPVDQNYTRIKDITLSYSLTQKALDKIKLGSLTAFVSGRNIATFTDWVGLDPELSVSNTQSGLANSPLSYGIYPLVSTFVFGLNITLR